MNSTLKELVPLLELAVKNSLSPLSLRPLTAVLGIPGLDMPRNVGGQQWSNVKMAEAFAVCGYADLDFRDLPGGGHSRLIGYVATHRYDNLLSSVVQGKAFIAIAITEESGGSDIYNLQTLAIPHKNGYVISGTKRYVARIFDATHFIVFAQVQREDTVNRLSVFLVPSTHEGVRLKPIQTMGLKGTSFGEICFDNCFIDNRMRIGGEGQGFSLFRKHFAYWRVGMAAAAIGCARFAIEQTTSYLLSRHSFGGPIGRFTHLQQELAIHISKLHMCWLLVMDVMKRLDNNLPIYVDAAMVKAEAIEVAISAVSWSIQTHGARGYTTEYDLEKRLRDLYGLRIADGTTEVLRGQVARSVLGNELYELSLGRRKHAVIIGENQFTRRFW